MNPAINLFTIPTPIFDDMSCRTIYTDFTPHLDYPVEGEGFAIITSFVLIGGLLSAGGASYIVAKFAGHNNASESLNLLFELNPNTGGSSSVQISLDPGTGDWSATATLFADATGNLWMLLENFGNAPSVQLVQMFSDPAKLQQGFTFDVRATGYDPTAGAIEVDMTTVQIFSP